MTNITTIFVFVLVLSTINVFRISFIFLRALLQTDPKPVSLSNRELLILYLSISYIITYVIQT